MLVGLGKTAITLLLATDIVQRCRLSVPKWSQGSDASQTAAVLHDLYGDASFWPTPWLGGLLGGHLQTIWYGLSKAPTFEFTEELWTTADGGTLGLAWAETPSSLPASAPVVLILPGLCGSIEGTGHTIHSMLQAGLRPVCLHARGCGVPLSSPRFNMFGDTHDLRDALGRIALRYLDGVCDEDELAPARLVRMFDVMQCSEGRRKISLELLVSTRLWYREPTGWARVREGYTAMRRAA